MPAVARLITLAVAFALAVSVAACSNAGTTASRTPPASGPPESGTPPPATAAPTPIDAPRVIIPLASGDPGPIPDGTITVDAGSETNGVSVCGGWVWVQVHSGADTVVKVDPASGKIVGRIEGGTNLACFEGEPWAAVDGTKIQHIDADTGKAVASVDVENAYYVGVGAGSIWTGSGPNVVRIDPQTTEIVATIPLHQRFDVTEVEGSDDAIWATVKAPELVYRIDPATNTVVAQIKAGAYAHGILVQPDAIWISNAHEETVTRIDPVTNATMFVTGPGNGVGLAEGGGYVWASSRDPGVLFRIDPSTSQATAVVTIDGWPYGIGYTEGRLWVGDGLTSVYGIPIGEITP